MSGFAEYFDDDDREAVAAAVAAAEERTAGEIVPCVVAASDDYEECAWKGAAIGALAGALLAWLLHLVTGRWGGSLLVWSLVPTACGFLAGFALAQMQPIKRLLVDRETLQRRVRERAETAFLDDEVFATRDRTGVLLFVSLFEHRVVVLTDSGIAARVDQARWDDLVAALTAAIADGRAGPGLIAAIERCGELLDRHGIEPRSDDVDELSDDMRFQST